ncbi:MAG: hypothetical protein ACKO96_41310 [Flammeovirgaceae bacterium]
MKIIAKFIVIFFGSSWLLTSLLFVGTIQSLVILGYFQENNLSLAQTFSTAVFGIFLVDSYYLLLLLFYTIFILWTDKTT